MSNSRNCGFFNSNEEGDRPYDAEDISQMMTGMVTGGVFPNVGDKFAVSASGTEVIIGTGKAWWHGKWFENLTEFTIDDGASSENDRIDMLVIEVNETEEVRDIYFKIIKGVPGSEPEEPEIINEGGIYQLPIAKITRLAGDMYIGAGNLEYLVGTIRSPWAETALDPNKCIYAYEDETEEIDLDSLCLSGKEVFSGGSFNVVSQTNPVYRQAIKTINFTKTFGKVPTIVAMIQNPYYSDVSSKMRVYVYDVTKTSMKIRLAVPDEAAIYTVDQTVHWIASGILNE